MRVLIASGVANLVLLVTVVVLLNGRGEANAIIDGLEADARAVAQLREADAKRVADVEARNGALLAVQAERCGAEGTDAFNRGVRTGIAVCQARAAQ